MRIGVLKSESNIAALFKKVFRRNITLKEKILSAYRDFEKARSKYGFRKAAYNLKGDCGVMALLFITLCRIVKIPARWQSGLYVNPTHVGNHDWVEFYVAPYGWLFADPSFGDSGYRTGNMKKWNFYFGNLDPFRMIENSDFQKALIPEKKFFRADPYDNQVGEAEYEDRGLYQEDVEAIKEIVDIHEI